MQIHPTAIVHESARLGEGCVIHAYALVDAGCELGAAVIVHPFAVLGGDPQDFSFTAGTSSGVRIGARTVIREHVTVSRATKADAYTEIGSDCFVMAGCHIAHDCHLANNVVMANGALLAGHVQIGERAFLGGNLAIHQFCRVGEGAMVGGMARISRDIPPFTLVIERNELIGLNIVGLRRRGFKREVINELKRALRLMNTPATDLRELASSALQDGSFVSPEAQRFLQFYTLGRRTFARLRSQADDDGAQLD